MFVIRVSVTISGGEIGKQAPSLFFGNIYVFFSVFKLKNSDVFWRNKGYKIINEAKLKF